MKILIIGGMHGNEPLGISIVEQLKARPIDNVSAVIANPEAKQQNVRFTNNDLNRSFPGSGDSYEEKRARYLLELCKGFDLVLDFHNTHCPENDCVFVGEGAGETLFDAASSIGLPRVIVADYDCINKYAPNCMSVEISLDSPLNDVETWLHTIEALTQMASLPVAQDIVKYRFVYRMTLDDDMRLGLRDMKLRAFQPLDSATADALGVSSPAYPIFIGDAYTSYNYGGVLREIV